MKTILCVTDFSGASEIAAMFSASLAKHFNAKLILFHNYEPMPVILPEPVMLTTLGETSQFLEKQLDDIKSLIDPMHIIDIDKKITSGSVVHNILTQVEECAPDVVICGMKGKGKALRQLFGSTATGLARKLDVPLIIVPEYAIYSGIKTIALATEEDIPFGSDNHFLDVLSDIGKEFKSKLLLIRVAKNKFKEAFELLYPPTRLNKALKKLDPEFDCISGKDVEESLNRFVKDHHVDMMVILSHHHSLLERLWNSDTTREMIFHSKVPLMIFPEKVSHAFTPAEESQRNE